MPITLQTAFVTLAGYLLGERNGLKSVLIYMALGLLGIPVFTGGGGIGYIFKPTFGYIIGFAFGAYITGKLTGRRSEPTYFRLIAAGAAGLSAIYAIGAAYYVMISKFYLNMDITAYHVIITCFAMVVPGDILMTFAAAFAARRILPKLQKENAG